MDAELIQAWAAILGALAWPVVILLLALFLRGLIIPTIKKGGVFRFRVKDMAEIEVQPAQGLRPPSASGEGDQAQLKQDVEEVLTSTSETLPPDYYFLNHTSFLRKNKQAEFRQRTGVPLDHYDIHVIVDSYYRGALARVDRVEYILHRAFPSPIQYRRNPEDNFLLKELANGEFVLMAKVYLKERAEPILLQRYITLWDSGPRLG